MGDFWIDNVRTKVSASGEPILSLTENQQRLTHVRRVDNEVMVNEIWVLLPNGSKQIDIYTTLALLGNVKLRVTIDATGRVGVLERIGDGAEVFSGCQ